MRFVLVTKPASKPAWWLLDGDLQRQVCTAIGP